MGNIQISTHRKLTAPSSFSPACLLTACKSVWMYFDLMSCWFCLVMEPATLGRSLSLCHSCPSDSWPFHPPALIQDVACQLFPSCGGVSSYYAHTSLSQSLLFAKSLCWYSSPFHFFPFNPTAHSFDLSHRMHRRLSRECLPVELASCLHEKLHEESNTEFG